MSHERYCFVCGTDNDRGLKLKSNYDLKHDYGYLDFYPEKYHQSYDGIFHGGLQAAIMDSVMVNLLNAKGVKAVTAKMDIRFKEPVENNKMIRVEARVSDSRQGLYKVSAKIYQNSKLKTECNAVFMESENVY
jgi:acyl-coenzyme A thioesterase PaaI-like protein